MAAIFVEPKVGRGRRAGEQMPAMQPGDMEMMREMS